MDASLRYLSTLPDNTVVYNGHEYTAGNLAFAKSIDGENPGIARLAEIVEQNKTTTGLTTIGDEKEWNVFMRLQTDAVRFVKSRVSRDALLVLIPEKTCHRSYFRDSRQCYYGFTERPEEQLPRVSASGQTRSVV